MFTMMASSPPSPETLQQNQSRRVYAVTITGYCVAILAVVLRLVARKVTKARFWWDDFLIAMALVKFNAR